MDIKGGASFAAADKGGASSAAADGISDGVVEQLKAKLQNMTKMKDKYRQQSTRLAAKIESLNLLVEKANGY